MFQCLTKNMGGLGGKVGGRQCTNKWLSSQSYGMVFISVYLFAELAANHRFISFFSEKTKTSCLKVWGAALEKEM